MFLSECGFLWLRVGTDKLCFPSMGWCSRFVDAMASPRSCCESWCVPFLSVSPGYMPFSFGVLNATFFTQATLSWEWDWLSKHWQWWENKPGLLSPSWQLKIFLQQSRLSCDIGLVDALQSLFVVTVCHLMESELSEGKISLPPFP